MLAATRARPVRDADALVSAAAISDYTVEGSDEKIRSGRELTLELEPTPKLIDEIRTEYPDLPIVGFKAETSGDDGAMIEQARTTLERADLAFVVANDASERDGGGDDERAARPRERRCTLRGDESRAGWRDRRFDRGGARGEAGDGLSVQRARQENYMGGVHPTELMGIRPGLNAIERPESSGTPR